MHTRAQLPTRPTPLASPEQRDRIAEIRDNLEARIAEAEREGSLGEIEGLRVSLAGAEDKLAQLDERARRATTINLGMPAFSGIADRAAPLPTLGQEPCHNIHARTDADVFAYPNGIPFGYIVHQERVLRETKPKAKVCALSIQYRRLGHDGHFHRRLDIHWHQFHCRGPVAAQWRAAHSVTDLGGHPCSGHPGEPEFESSLISADPTRSSRAVCVSPVRAASLRTVLVFPLRVPCGF